VYYQGSVRQGLKYGQGTEFYPNGNLRYSGKFKANGYDGQNVVVYNSYLEDNILLEGNFENGKLWGPVNFLWYRDNVQNMLSYCMLWNAHYVNGQLHSLQDEHIKENKKMNVTNPCMDFRYEGFFITGKKEGYGEIYCYDTQKFIFKGIFKDNLPLKNAGRGDDSLVFLNHRNGNRMFEGTIKREKRGKRRLYGECIIYPYHGGTGRVLYDGPYKARSLATIIFCTWDLELLNYSEFFPKF
jgi:antitoxin component YwqK of YwqJK toxin-antitoxin module